MKLVQYSIFLVLIAIQSNTAYAGIYKCKQANGSTEYSSKPCPRHAKQLAIKNIKSKTKLNTKLKKKVSFDKINKLSDGLNHIRMDGFGNFSLKNLKDQLKEGKRIHKKVSFLKQKHWGSHYYEIQTHSNKQITLFYVVSGMNYDIYDNPAKQRLENEDDQLESFIDITMEDVNNHAVSIGLDRKKIHKSGLAGDLSWKWNSNGFNCELSVDIFRWVTPHDLLYSCSYSTSK